MLIPQFSIRWLLKVTTGCAVVFSIFGLAVRGSGWAQGISIGVLALVVLMLAYALLFTLLWIFSVVASPVRRRVVGRGRSPFLCNPAAPPQTLTDSTDGREVPATPVILEEPPCGTS